MAGRQQPTMENVGRVRARIKCNARPEGAGETDETIASVLDVSARRVGRWHRQAVDEGPEAVWERRGPAIWTAPAKRRFLRRVPAQRSAAPSAPRTPGVYTLDGSWLHMA